MAVVPREIGSDASTVPGPVHAGLLHRRANAERASRTLPRRIVGPAPGVRRPAATVVRLVARTVERPVAREARTVRARMPRSAPKNIRGATERRPQTASDRGSLRAVVAFAKSQVGKRYVRGGEGPGGFDCSGFTKRAYARAGYRLPHSSGAQARRARSVSRSVARPGDLVVGRGHVGIYMGDGMMIDAGNRRTGVVYRKLYRGLSVARLG
ncbi:cell wall-associated NlpC family hydrolase [Actinoplanes campanulatus]|uniref:Cell wall-associated NlpC family hydrolase n=1 Tax=Actinoplanes campanulatus TaxID=113559 RepID=A0A7W5AQ51_9ACTN|nr:NlpC/P60 family protein [Actinoplanes campanulatus]MBB3100397.1 cell wall-associated NlpC family hydrolase [Actinoplanes campanulatus]GGN24592.1 hypothetical protein GCM10010109_40230 [Actinoplanes campanulatus]GID39565.1 hypothetical protein Aca09nite_60710 [Actinoplanes campanulatus]